MWLKETRSGSTRGSEDEWHADSGYVQEKSATQSHMMCVRWGGARYVTVECDRGALVRRVRSCGETASLLGGKRRRRGVRVAKQAHRERRHPCWAGSAAAAA